MTAPLPAYRAEIYMLGQLRDGRRVIIQPMTPWAADILGPATAAMEPWAHYGFDADRVTAAFNAPGSGAISYQVECENDVVAGVVIRCPWLHGPYLETLAILSSHQSQGIGAAILAWFECEARGRFRNLWVCVSAFNVNAQRFYRAHGFDCVATLAGLMSGDFDELLMRKRIVTRNE